MARTKTQPADRPRPIERRSRVSLAGGFKRTALLAVGGLLLVVVAAGCLGASFVIRPSSRAGAVMSRDVVIDPNNLTGGLVEFPIHHRSGARYDFYLTAEERDANMGDYCQFDVNAYKGEGNSSSRYLTYAYIYFGSDVVRTRREGSTKYETYEMDRNVHVSSRSESIRISFTPTSAWFTGNLPITATIDVVEITPTDRLLLLGRSVMQVTTFPLGFLGVVMLWLAVMRQLRLIGVRVSPPPAREYKAPPGRAARAQEALEAGGGTP